MIKFIDQATIIVVAGSGGHGCLSFKRERCLPKGGPDGGDGGSGGSVYLQADDSVSSLIDFHYNKTFKAKPGRPGSGKNKIGACGEDCVIKVPLGTSVFDADSDQLLVDLVELEHKVCIARGGEAGLGNVRFKSSTNRAPRKTTTGGDGESRRLRLELKVIADVGLLGLPNAGKSSLIRVISKARPKVAGYAFTTTRPYLGVVHLDAGREFVVADIPGLIQGAADGAGLGHHFLRHLSRCKLLLHLVSVYEAGDYDVFASIADINKELEDCSADLVDKVKWLVLTKIDLISDVELDQLIEKINQTYPHLVCITISSISNIGTKDLTEMVWQELN